MAGVELFTLLGKLGLDSSEFVQGMKDAVNEAGGFKTVMSKLTNNIIAGVNKMTDYADKVDKGSKRIGLSAKAYQELDYALGMSGANIDTLRNGISNLNGELEGTSGKNVSEAFKKLGFDKETLKNLGSTDEQLTAILDSLAGITDTSTRKNIADTIFGKNAGASLEAFFAEGQEGIARLRQEANDLGIVISDESIKQGVQAKDSMDKLNKTLDSLLNNAVLPLLPLVTNIVDIIAPVLGDISTLLRDVIKGLFRFLGLDTEYEEQKAQQKVTGEQMYNEIGALYDQGKYNEARALYGDKAFNIVSQAKSSQMWNPEDTSYLSAAYKELGELADSMGATESSSENASTALDGVTSAANSAAQAAGNAANAMNSISYYSYTPHAKGLWDVPYDNYPALLHRGERVLTASQARQSGSIGNINAAELHDSILSAIRQGMSGINLRAHVVQKEVTDAVNTGMNNQLKSMRFST